MGRGRDSARLCNCPHLQHLERLVLLPDGVCCVYFGALEVALLDGFHHVLLLLGALLLTLLRQLLELLRGELHVEDLLCAVGDGRGRKHTEKEKKVRHAEAETATQSRFEYTARASRDSNGLLAETVNSDRPRSRCRCLCSDRVASPSIETLCCCPMVMRTLANVKLCLFVRCRAVAT